MATAKKYPEFELPPLLTATIKDYLGPARMAGAHVRPFDGCYVELCYRRPHLQFAVERLLKREPENFHPGDRRRTWSTDLGDGGHHHDLYHQHAGRELRVYRPVSCDVASIAPCDGTIPTTNQKEKDHGNSQEIPGI